PGPRRRRLRVVTRRSRDQRPATTRMRREPTGQIRFAARLGRPVGEEGPEWMKTVVGHVPRPHQIPEGVEDLGRIAATHSLVDVGEETGPVGAEEAMNLSGPALRLGLGATPEMPEAIAREQCHPTVTDA